MQIAIKQERDMMESKTLEELKALCRKLLAMLQKKHPFEQIPVPAQNLRLMSEAIVSIDEERIQHKDEAVVLPMPLTLSQRRNFDAIVALIKELGTSPSIRQVAERLGYKSHTSAKFAIDVLISKGYVQRSPIDGMIQVVQTPE